METINLYFDFEFTSLSPDAQPISLGIVSDICSNKTNSEALSDFVVYGISKEHISEKSFYAEFSDFDINRCDNWVKENVVSKLNIWNNADFEQMKINGDWKYGLDDEQFNDGLMECFGSIKGVSENLHHWLKKRFSEYQIQFICDCGTWDWYWMVQLLAEWNLKKPKGEYLGVGQIGGIVGEVYKYNFLPIQYENGYRVGLPKLPDNISPVPFDLNDLIAIKKGITPKKAFDLSRTTFYSVWHRELLPIDFNEHNALWDAKVIKEIYNKLKQP